MFTLLLVLVHLITIRSDTPASCYTDQFLGDWEFRISTIGVKPHLDSVQCPHIPSSADYANSRILKLRLLTNGRVLNMDTGSRGHWSPVAAQGAEVTIDGWKYFWFANYELIRSYDYAHPDKNNEIKIAQTVISDCGRIRVGQSWAHESVIAAREHYCMLSGYNFNPHVIETNTSMMYDEIEGPVNPDDEKTVSDTYKEFDETDYSEENRPANLIRHFKLTEVKSEILPEEGSSDLTRPLGGPNTDYGYTQPSYNMYAGDKIPDEIDYRNLDGKSYVVNPTMDQKGCGSCFLVASVHAISARIMVDSNLEINFNDKSQPRISLQHPLDCSNYSQACTGGFGEEMGKFAEDFGLLTEDAYGSPYLAKKNPTCMLITSTEDDHKDLNSFKQNKRFYVNNYEYLGGYYGSGESTFNAMKRELFNYGPFATSVYANDDFRQCKSTNSEQNKLIGENIPQQTSESEKDGYQRSYYYKRTNHLVVIVGLVMKEGKPHWVVQNSWGDGWCDNGFTYIEAGTNQYNIETAPVVFTWVDKRNLTEFGGKAITPEKEKDNIIEISYSGYCAMIAFLVILLFALVVLVVLFVLSMKNKGKVCLQKPTKIIDEDEITTHLLNRNEEEGEETK